MNKSIGFLTLFFTCLLGVGLSLIVYTWDGGSSPIFYWGIMPGLPFILIALYAGLIKRNAAKGSLVGAVIAALCVTLICYGALYYDSLNYSGGGANIGLGLLLLPLPAYYFVFTLIGWYCGGCFKKET